MQYPKPYKRAGRGGVYYFRFTDRDGKRNTVSTGCTVLKDRPSGEPGAITFIQRYVNARSYGEYQKFRDYADRFFIWETCPHVARLQNDGDLIGRQHVERSRKMLESWIFTDTAFSDLPLNRIARRDVEDLRTRLRDMCPGGNTAGKALTAAKTVLAEAAYRGDIPTDPGSGIAASKYRRLERGAFTVDEVRLILQYAPDLASTAKSKTMGTHRRRDAEVFLYLIFGLGLRIGELRALRWGNIDLENRRFSVLTAVKDNAGTIGKPKRDHQRRNLSLPSIVADALEGYRKHIATATAGPDEPDGFTQPTDFVLCTPDRGPVSITWVKKSFDRILEHAKRHPKVKLDPAPPDREPDPAGIDDDQPDRWLTPHSARHSLNTALLSAHVSPLDVQTFLGWQSEAGRALTTVQRGYTALEFLDTRTVADAVDRIYQFDQARIFRVV